MHIPLPPAYSSIFHWPRRLLIHVTESGIYQPLPQIHHTPHNYFNGVKSKHIFNADQIFFPPVIKYFPPLHLYLVTSVIK